MAQPTACRGLSCILPAFNEAPRLAQVLAAVCGHPQISEVIVVDDGSTDGTAALAAGRRGVRLIRHATNRGKSAAVATGIAAARHDLLLLLDADLLGLAPADLTALIAPVLDGRADAAISLRRNAPAPWRWIGLDYISGERVAPRALLGPPEDLARLPRFGLEVAMNRRWIAAGARIAVVRWPAVASPAKAAKRGGWRAGLRADLAMLADIFAILPPQRALGQILRLRALALPRPQGASGARPPAGAAMRKRAVPPR